MNRLAMLACTCALMMVGCADETGSPGDGGTGSDLGTSSDSGGSMDGAQAGDGALGSDSGIVPGATACSNGLDDDSDGLVDGLDPECTGPADNDEGTFGTGIPGDNRDPMWQDCFFDGNSGAGDDHCRYRTECLTGELPQSDADCMVSAACVEFCQPGTPNGCDCFGCCAVQRADGSSVNIVLGGTCSESNLDDETACPRCTPTDSCDNPCGECELCPGKTAADLPSTCWPADAGVPDGGWDDGGVPPPYSCDNGETVCASQSDCPDNYTCELGCCLMLLF